jgi:23S rRNA pseudouridine955/2504/2580 synthase
MKKSPSETVIVESDDADRRLDNYLLSRLKGLPRALIYRMIRGGEVRVNKGRARPSRRLAAGDRVRIPPVQRTVRRADPVPDRTKADWIEERIFYEDRDILILNKPSGLAVHGGSGVSFGAIELLRRVRAQRNEKNRLELVHRLDRATSGCLLVAKRHASLRHLHEQFRDGTVRKGYSALLIGSWPGGTRTVDAPLATGYRRGGERHVQVDAEGKVARTRFTPKKQFENSVFVAALLDTGRTHQIRVHAAHIGHPVAGDARYGADPDPVSESFGLRRLFLHASTLAFESPGEGGVIQVECPLDEELKAVLAALETAGASNQGKSTPR